MSFLVFGTVIFSFFTCTIVSLLFSFYFFGKFQKGVNDFSSTGFFSQGCFQSTGIRDYVVGDPVPSPPGPRFGECTPEQSLHLYTQKETHPILRGTASINFLLLQLRGSDPDVF